MFDFSDTVGSYARGGAGERGAIFTRREVVEFILDLADYTVDRHLHGTYEHHEDAYPALRDRADAELFASRRAPSLRATKISSDAPREREKGTFIL